MENCCATFPQPKFPHSTRTVENFLDKKFLCVTFLWPNKKVTKEVGSRGAEWIAPALQSRPLENPPARTWQLLEHLNLHPDQRENVPIFSLMVNSSLTAGRGERSPRRRLFAQSVVLASYEVRNLPSARGRFLRGRI